MRHARGAAIFKAFRREALIDLARDILVLEKAGVGVDQIERAGIAYRHQWQRVALRQSENPDIQRQEADGVDGPDLARAGAGSRLDFGKLQVEFWGDVAHRLVELGTGAFGRTAGVIGEFHDCPASSWLSRRRAAAAAPV